MHFGFFTLILDKNINYEEHTDRNIIYDIYTRGKQL